MRTINNDIVHDNLFKNKPLLAYEEGNDYEKWKGQVRDQYIKMLGLDVIAQNACEIQVEIEETVETDEYTRYRYVFESEKDCPVPCYLLIPKTGKEKYPVCVCVQGLLGHGAPASHFCGIGNCRRGTSADHLHEGFY